LFTDGFWYPSTAIVPFISAAGVWCGIIVHPFNVIKAVADCHKSRYVTKAGIDKGAGSKRQ